MKPLFARTEKKKNQNQNGNHTADSRKFYKYLMHVLKILTAWALFSNLNAYIVICFVFVARNLYTTTNQIEHKDLFANWLKINCGCGNFIHIIYWP